MRRLKHRLLPILVSLPCLAAASCSKPKAPGLANSTPQPNATTPASPVTVAGPDACVLLTREETQEVQGEPFKETKPSRKSAAGLEISQCYFELPTAVNSIVLTVTRKAEEGRDPSDSWRDIFHREKAREKKEEGEEKEPQKIEG